MGLSPGTRLGPYEIVALLGAGGMGEVYRARDTRLGRDVAIKVLPPGVTSTPEARVRFEREARAISQLNHPNICTLHDVGREGDTDFLVMELVSGGSLRDRLARKALPLEQVLSLGIEIADALEYAHARGIVHRDLKPGNILLTERGQAKVVDFGLATVVRRGAKAPGAASASSATTAAITETEEHLTSPGQTVGTQAYMSPEQARGEEVDARSDVFSLGAVLYEMASAHRAFEGSAPAVIFEAILNRMPAPVSLLKPDTPQELDRILEKGLEKDRELRYQTAGEVRSDLKRLKRDLDSSRVAGAAGDSGSRVRAATVPPLPAPVILRRRIIRIAWAAAAVVGVAAAIFLLIRWLFPPQPPPAPLRLSIEAPAGVYSMGTPAISPDGSYLAFSAADSNDVTRIWIRPMDGATSRPLPGTEGAYRPFWSPDSKSVGFVAGDKLRKIEITGGQPVTISDGISAGDGSWGSAGTILLDGVGHLLAVNASGGQASQVTWADQSRGEMGAAWPQFLPDGKHFLYLAGVKTRADSTTLRVGRLGSKESKIIAIGEFSRVQYVAPGFLMFLRGRTLLAQPFDSKRFRMTGDAFPVLDDVLRADAAGNAEFSASGMGTLVYRDEVALGRQRLVWLDRTGQEIGSLGPTARYYMGVSLSPDERRVAVSIASQGETNPDIWILDVASDVATRLTSDPGWEYWPVWSPDGTTIYFYSGRHNSYRVRMKPASGIGEERELPMPPGDAAPQAVTPDGRFLLAYLTPPGGRMEIVKVSLGANPSTTPLGIRGFHQSLSRDGKWLAYSSNESGRSEVYVVDFPGLTGKWRVSIDGGSMPRWSADGRELFFVTPDYKLMSVPVTTAPAFRLGRPARVLGAAPEIGGLYAPASDGKRFLDVVDLRGERLPPTKVVLNWQAAVRRR